MIPAAAARPRFRTDLVAEPIQEDGKLFVDVFDPDSGTGFRFYEVEYSLACAMDGERDVAGLVRWAREELGVEPTAKELAQVITTLGDLGYLAGESAAEVGDLAAGVISGPAIAPPRVEEFELGTAGGAVAATGDLPRVDVELGQAGGVSSPRVTVDDFGTGPELASRDDFPPPPVAQAPTAQLRPTSIPDSDHDGPTDLPRPVPLAAGDEDVSTDLSDHLAISASDVKEAVRASKVMNAVDIPADIMATLAAAESEAEARAAADKAAADEKAAVEAAEKAAAEKTAAEKAAAEKTAAEKTAAEKTAAEKTAAEKAAAAQAAADRAAQAVVRPAGPASLVPAADKAAAAQAVADKAAADKAAKGTDTTTKLPDKGATKTTKPPVKTPVEVAEEPRTSRALIALLIIVILLAGAYLVWTQILKKPLPWEKAKPATVATPVRTAPPAPPPPPPPSSILNEVPGTTTVVGATRQGVIVQVIANASKVAAGDELARFAANPALTKQLAAGKQRLEIDLPKLIDELTAKRDAAVTASKPPEVIKVAQDKLDKQLQVKASLEAEVASLTQQLDAYAVKAPLAGTVKVEVAKGATVKLEQPIASITELTVLKATFTANPGFTAMTTARVAVKGTPAQGIECKVAAIDGSSVTVECPNDAGIVAGTEVVLQ